MLHFSPACTKLVEAAEGLYLKAYRCPSNVLTIGYGHTGPDVREGLVITAAQADALLANDLNHFAIGLDKLVPNGLNQNQYDALVSFSFYVGIHNLETSTLLRKLKAGDMKGAAAEFPRWNIGGPAGAKRILPGLVTRRLAEQRAFLHGDYTYPPRG
jgi:lysozyme